MKMEVESKISFEKINVMYVVSWLLPIRWWCSQLLRNDAQS